jgi:uncharacterized Fe-S radical SAM superfamily protein PflX
VTTKTPTDKTVKDITQRLENWRESFQLGTCKVCHQDGRVHKRQGKCGTCMVAPLYPQRRAS